jgi:hypothetical protein
MPDTVGGDEGFGSTTRDAWLLRLDASKRLSHDDLAGTGLGSAVWGCTTRAGLDAQPHACAAAATQPASARPDAHRSSDASP